MRLRKSLRQLLRTPLRTALFVLLLTLVGTFLCLGGGVWATAQQGLHRAETEFTTIAIPNMMALRELAGVQNALYNPYNLTVMARSQKEQREAQARLISLYDQVKQVGLSSDIAQPAQNNMLRAYAGETVGGIRPDEVLSTAWFYDQPLDRVAYLATCTDVNVSPLSLQTIGEEDGEAFRYISKTTVSANQEIYASDRSAKAEIFYVQTAAFQVDEILGLHKQAGRDPEWLVAVDPNAVRTDVGPEDVELEELTKDSPYEIGKQYILIGRYLQEGDAPDAHLLMKNGKFARLQAEYNQIGIARRVGGMLLMPKDHQPDTSNAYYDKCIQVVFDQNIPYERMMTTVEGTLEEFFEDPQNAYWRDVVSDIQTTLHSVDVVATDDMNSLHAFHESRLSITEGRAISQQEYAQGANVCLISKLFAKQNNLRVDGSLSLSFHDGRYSASRVYQKTESSIAPVSAQPYDASLGMTQAKEYAIVGIYEGEVAWDVADYAVGANTVLLPSGSLPEVPQAAEYALPADAYAPSNTFTLTLPNDAAQTFYDAMGEVEYGRMYTLLDQGYSAVTPGLRVIRNNALMLLGICLVAWAAIVVLFLLLFVLRQRREAGVMLSLGAGKGKTARHLLAGVLAVALLSAGLSIGAGLLTYEVAFDVALRGETVESTRIDQYSEMPVAAGSEEERHAALREAFVPENAPALVSAIAALQFLVIGVAAWVCILQMLKENPMELVRSKEG